MNLRATLQTLQRLYANHIDPDGIQPIQAVRTVVAAILAILLYHSLPWTQAYWILFSTVLILQTYNAPTPQQKWISLSITGCSVTLVTFVASLLGKIGFVLALFLGMTTFIAVYLNVVSSDMGTAAFYVNLFCLSSGAMSVSLPETAERTASVFLGFIIAMIVCGCVWPERLSKTLRSIIAQNLLRLSEFNKALMERHQSEKVIAVRRNRLIRGFARARITIPPEEIQTWQIVYQIEYLYEIILGLNEMRQLLEKQKILRVLNKELAVLSRRLTWLLRGLSRSVERNTAPPPISKFIRLLRTFEPYYARYLKRFNQERLLAFTVYIDTVYKLERRLTGLTELLKRLEYYA